MITPQTVSPSTLIGNAAVSLTPAPIHPCPAPAAANADCAAAPAAPLPAAQAPRRPVRLPLSLRLALLLWALGTALLVGLDLASRLL